MERYRAQLFNAERMTLGESMLWDDEGSRALWVDIPGGGIFEADEHGNLLGVKRIPDQATTVAVARDGMLIVAGARGVYRVGRDVAAFGKIADLSGLPQNQRLNDGKCDSRGRLLIGSMVTDGSEPAASLFAITEDGNINVLRSGLGCSNGIGFSPCGRYLYHIDTPTRKVLRFRYDADAGAIFDPEVAVDVSCFEGLPDGMAVDREGLLYVAMWGGGAVLCFDPEQRKIRAQVDLPCRLVTSCAFGGAALDELLITTARWGDNNPCAGQTYRAKVKAMGMRSFRFG